MEGDGNGAGACSIAHHLPLSIRGIEALDEKQGNNTVQCSSEHGDHGHFSGVPTSMNVAQRRPILDIGWKMPTIVGGKMKPVEAYGTGNESKLIVVKEMEDELAAKQK